MAKERTADDNEPLGIIESIMELWNKPHSNPDWTTSDKMEAVNPEQAKQYRLSREIWQAQQDIKALLEKQEKERTQTKAAVKRGIMQIIKGIWPD